LEHSNSRREEKAVIRDDRRYGRTYLVYVATGMRREKEVQPRTIRRGDGHSRRSVFRIRWTDIYARTQRRMAPYCGTLIRSVPTRRLTPLRRKVARWTEPVRQLPAGCCSKIPDTRFLVGCRETYCWLFLWTGNKRMGRCPGDQP